MAIVKCTNISSNDIGSLDRMDKYICDSNKTSRRHIGCRGCPPELWVQQVKANKHIWHSESKRQLRQLVMGFDPHDKIRCVEAVRVANDVAKYFKGHTVKYAVHRNTEHLHIHFLVDNTSYIDGKQLDMSKSDLKRFKEYCSEVLTKHGCSKVRMAQHFRYDGMPDGKADIDELEIGDEMYIDNAEEIICEPVAKVVPEITVSDSGSCTKPPRVYVNNYYSIYNAPREYIQNQTVTRQSSGYANSHNHQQGSGKSVQRSFPHSCRSDTVKDSCQNEREMTYFEKYRQKLKSSGRKQQHQPPTGYFHDFDEPSAVELEWFERDKSEMPMDILPDDVDCSKGKGFFDREPVSEQRLTPFIPLPEPAEAKVYVIGTPTMLGLTVICIPCFDYQSAVEWIKCNADPQYQYTIHSLGERIFPFNML